MLEEAMVPGSSSTDTTTTHTPPGVAEIEALRAERHERSAPRIRPLTYLPESDTPADLDVVMAVGHVKTLLATAYDHLLQKAELPRPCRRCGHDAIKHRENLPTTEAGGLRERPCCRCPGFNLRYVPPADPSWQTVLTSVGDAGAMTVEGALASARRAVERAVDANPVGKLILVPCPWCGGVTDAMPQGSYTLRVFTPGAAPETYVLCLNPRCSPPEDHCGGRRHGRPMWPFHELDWLASRLDEEAARRDESRGTGLENGAA